MDMFRVCPHCDFEWHQEDGDSCPACSMDPEDESKSARASERYSGGAFGTGPNPGHMQGFYKALGLLALVFLLYVLLGGN